MPIKFLYSLFCLLTGVLSAMSSRAAGPGVINLLPSDYRAANKNWAVAECLCAELPMLLLGKAYGQEKSNTVMLTSFGASMHATTSRELVMQLTHLHDNKEALHGLLVNASALRRPDAAADIVRATMRLVGVPCDRERHFAEFYWGGKPAHAR